MTQKFHNPKYFLAECRDHVLSGNFLLRDFYFHQNPLLQQISTGGLLCGIEIQNLLHYGALTFFCTKEHQAKRSATSIFSKCEDLCVKNKMFLFFINYIVLVFPKQFYHKQILMAKNDK